MGTNNDAVALFDEAAASWDKPIRVELAKGVTAAIRNRLQLDTTQTALEFGCGTGLVTALLAPHLLNIVAVDTSTGMLEALEEKLNILGIDNVTPKLLDLTCDPLPAHRFDLIFSSMTMHHIEDIGQLLRIFHSMLAQGGRIALADLAREDGTFHSDHTGVVHLGLEEEEFLQMAGKAGFADLTMETAHVICKEGNDGKEHEYPVLLLTGRKE